MPDLEFFLMSKSMVCLSLLWVLKKVSCLALKPRNCRCRIYLFFHEPMRSTFCLLNKQMLTKFCSHCVKIVSNDKFGLVNQLFTKWEMSIVLVTYFWFALSKTIRVRCFFLLISCFKILMQLLIITAQNFHMSI